jgi:hypothetical protein
MRLPLRELHTPFRAETLYAKSHLCNHHCQKYPLLYFPSARWARVENRKNLGASLGKIEYHKTIQPNSAHIFNLLRCCDSVHASILPARKPYTWTQFHGTPFQNLSLGGDYCSIIAVVVHRADKIKQPFTTP